MYNGQWCIDIVKYYINSSVRNGSYDWLMIDIIIYEIYQF